MLITQYCITLWQHVKFSGSAVTFKSPFLQPIASQQRGHGSPISNAIRGPDYALQPLLAFGFMPPSCHYYTNIDSLGRARRIALHPPSLPHASTKLYSKGLLRPNFSIGFSLRAIRSVAHTLRTRCCPLPTLKSRERFPPHLEPLQTLPIQRIATR